MKSIATLLAFVALAFVAATPADAHGPTRQKVMITAEVAASPDEVWAVIGNFQDMSWHPAVFETKGEGGNAVDATRVLTLGEAGGGVIDEILYKYDADRRRYSYRITEVALEVLPVTNYSSHLYVEPAGDGTLITWRGAFIRGYPNNDPPEHLNDQAAIDAVTAVYEAGMAALVARFGAMN